MTKKSKTEPSLTMDERTRILAEARRLHAVEGELEIDEGARISRAKGNPDGGAYVQAWVWVPDAPGDASSSPCDTSEEPR
jgi:hypothetical protein